MNFALVSIRPELTNFQYLCDTWISLSTRRLQTGVGISLNCWATSFGGFRVLEGIQYLVDIELVFGNCADICELLCS